jgi:hypothetical protein
MLSLSLSLSLRRPTLPDAELSPKNLRRPSRPPCDALSQAPYAPDAELTPKTFVPFATSV